MRRLLLIAMLGCGPSTNQDSAPPPTPTPPTTPPPAAPVESPTRGESTDAPITLTTLATLARSNPFDLVVHGGHVYWTDRLGGTVWRVPTKGGAPEQLAQGLDEPRSLAVEPSGRVIVSTERGVVALGEGSPTQLLPERAEAMALGADGLHVSLASGSLVRLGAKGVTKLAKLDDGALELIVHGENTFAVTVGGSVWRVSPGKPAVKLATLPNDGMELAIVGNELLVYPFGGSDLLAVPLAGGAPRTWLANVGEVNGLATDGTRVYWTNMERGEVLASPIGQPSIQRLATGQSRALGLRVDGGALYWFTWYLGQKEAKIQRAPLR